METLKDKPLFSLSAEEVEMIYNTLNEIKED